MVETGRLDDLDEDLDYGKSFFKIKDLFDDGLKAYERYKDNYII